MKFPVLGVVGAVSISELGAAVVDVAAQCFEKVARKSRAGVVVLEKALWDLSKEGVFQRQHSARGAPTEVGVGFGG